MSYVFLGGAWPYANSSRHIGHLASSMLPADIYARYRRLAGDKVIFVSGSDAHGTPILVKAQESGVEPKEIVDRFHEEYMEQFIQLGISYNCFYRTDSSLHWKITKEVYSNLKARNYIDIQKSHVATIDGKSLPDRYIKGTCSYCGYPHARGDQCDSCGKLMDKNTLIEPRSLLDNRKVNFKYEDNLFLKLEDFKTALESWFRSSYFNRSSVERTTREYIATLRSRSISREISWGISVDEKKLRDQRFYVWFDAVIGYITASIVAAGDSGENWKKWWTDDDSARFFFFGKDNLIFHSIFLSSILLGGGGGKILPRYFRLPNELIASEFVVEKKEADHDSDSSRRGDKISASRGNAADLTLKNLIANYDSDYIRYYLTIDGPEGKDTIFDKDLFRRRINNELIAKWGNLWYRITSMIYKEYGGYISYSTTLFSSEYNRLHDNLLRISKYVELSLEEFKFSQALKQIMHFVDELNLHVSSNRPWSMDRENAEIVLSDVLLLSIECNRLLWPFIPFSSSRIVKCLFDTDIIVSGNIRQERQDDAVRHLYTPVDTDALSLHRYSRPSKQITPLLLYKKLE